MVETTNFILLNEFIVFLKKQRIVEGAIIFAIGGLLRKLMYQISSGILAPISKGQVKKVIQQDWSHYLSLIFQIILGSYIFFLFYKLLTILYKGK